MRRRVYSLPVWIAVVMTAWGSQAVPSLQSLRDSHDSLERVASFGGTSLVPAGADTEPWEVRVNPIAQVLAKLEQAAVAAAPRIGDGFRRESPRPIVLPTFGSPALLRLADDLSHVRLLI